MQKGARKGEYRKVDSVCLFAIVRVRTVGLEPTRLGATVLKTAVSTSSTKCAVVEKDGYQSCTGVGVPAKSPA